MAVAYESSTTANFASSDTVTLNKPTGLTEGDLLIAKVGLYGNTSSASAPAGWEEVVFEKQSASGFSLSLYCFAKIATSTETAASNFSFTFGTSGVCGGILYRVSDAPIPDVSDADSTQTVANETTFSGGVTPYLGNSLFIITYIGSGSSAIGDPPGKDVALATDDPTWTNRLDINSALGQSGVMLSFSAIRTETTATGDYTVNYNASTGETLAAIILSISTYADASGTTALLSASPTFFESNGTSGSSGTADFTTGSPTFFEATGTGRSKTWTNEQRTSTSWVNEDRL